jgi:hypothetical protein
MQAGAGGMRRPWRGRVSRERHRCRPCAPQPYTPPARQNAIAPETRFSRGRRLAFPGRGALFPGAAICYRWSVSW